MFNFPTNHPAPHVNPRIQETLSEIGGRVKSGSFSGQPVYRLAWGQTEQHFLRGRMRLRFIDRKQPAIHTQERFFVAPEVFSRAAEWIAERNEDRIRRLRNLDLSVLSEKNTLSLYLAERELSKNYYQLESVRAPRKQLLTNFAGLAANTIVPGDWQYLTDIRDVEQIGKGCWYVLRHFAASPDPGAEKTWNDLRYVRNAYIPELNAVVPLADELGPYSRDGYWRAMIEIADFGINPETLELDERLWSYAEPGEQNCLEPIREIESERRNLSLQEKNPEWIAKQEIEEQEREKARLSTENTNRINSIINELTEPACGGKTHVFRS